MPLVSFRKGRDVQLTEKLQSNCGCRKWQTRARWTMCRLVLPFRDAFAMVLPRYWLLFYQCWTVGIASVFGVFVACLSKGRKLWEVVTYSFLVPVLVSLLWVCIWGGTGMRQDRQAVELEKLGLDYFDNSAHFLADGSDLCCIVPQEGIAVNDLTIFTNRLFGVTPVCKV
jgi:BCCT, betaine/carnitine/choline family transporter